MDKTKPRSTVYARLVEGADVQNTSASLTCEPCGFAGWTCSRLGVQRFYDEHGPHGVTPS